MWWLLGLLGLMILASPSFGTDLLRNLVQYRNGVLEADDLVKLREVGYRRASDLGFTDTTPARVVIEKLASEVTPPLAPAPSGVRLGTLFERTNVGIAGSSGWAQTLALVEQVPGRPEDAQTPGTWGALKSAIDDEMRRRAMI